MGAEGGIDRWLGMAEGAKRVSNGWVCIAKSFMEEEFT